MSIRKVNDDRFDLVSYGNLKRTRNHARKNCSKSERITLAHYILSLTMDDEEKRQHIINHVNLHFSDSHSMFGKSKDVYGFTDGSLLAYDDKSGWHKIDTFLRRSHKRLA
jgi:hypothetical protein